MKILFAHNNYQFRGGEDSVVEAEIEMLRSYGHDLVFYGRSNLDVVGLTKFQLAFQTFWSLRTAHELTLCVNDFRPDVIHVHNTFPLISPSLYWVAHQLGVPVVQTLHNFRLICPQAMFLREGQICEDCLGHFPWRGAVHGCYRGSKSQSSVLASMVSMHRVLGTWQSKVTRYIALNEFCRTKFIRGGLPADRILVKPNFVDFEVLSPVNRFAFLFVGRLSSEKGVEVMVRAFRSLSGGQVRVAGTGPEASLLDGVAGLKVLGALGGEAVRAEMNQAMALVLPSIWYENFPRTLVEAFASSLPVIASRIGALAELVEDGVTGLLFEPGNAQDLAQKMQWALDNPDAMAAMGRNARALYEREFTAERNYQQLMAIYQEAIEAKKAELNA